MPAVISHCHHWLKTASSWETMPCSKQVSWPKKKRSWRPVSHLTRSTAPMSSILNSSKSSKKWRSYITWRLLMDSIAIYLAWFTRKRIKSRNPKRPLFELYTRHLCCGLRGLSLALYFSQRTDRHWRHLWEITGPWIFTKQVSILIYNRRTSVWTSMLDCLGTSPTQCTFVTR